MTTIWAHILNHNVPRSDTIQTWSCKWKGSQPLQQDESVPGDMGNSSFGGLCSESRFALYGTLVVFLLLGVSVVVGMMGWVADKWAARRQRKDGVEMGGVGKV